MKIVVYCKSSNNTETCMFRNWFVVSNWAYINYVAYTPPARGGGVSSVADRWRNVCGHVRSRVKPGVNVPHQHTGVCLSHIPIDTTNPTSDQVMRRPSVKLCTVDTVLSNPLCNRATACIFHPHLYTVFRVSRAHCIVSSASSGDIWKCRSGAV